MGEQTPFSALVSLGYSKVFLGDRRYGIDKFIVNLWQFKVETVFRLPDSFSISVIRFICFHPLYHGDRSRALYFARKPVVVLQNVGFFLRI